ncbi:LacI family transcriptional regulator [Brevibacillus humidisoli]|uniref:LacI family DNA-binding transcriptional regulator n=1 Tax=Brevibacillus humidisoli TaxID=2895522 RepID=UPI001E389012|nr:LacI family DNA-binding transcriptional regulator [Brevibacillus humidisoli]UFJ39593.1 LacI family transcriptional regulator [Brevibacillus humidisoli]
MKNLTIKDVARRANVSIATVSRVINNKPWASEKAKEKVWQAIRELGYEPNALARGLVSGKSNTIGVLIPDVSNLFFAEVFRGMEDAVHERNSNVFICNTDSDKRRMLRYIKLLKEKQIEGVIFTSEEVTEEYFEALQQLHVPVVLVATTASRHELPVVKVDDHQAVYEAVTYLIQSGHREIGMISGPLDDAIAGSPRYHGYQAALADHRIPCKTENVVFGDYRFHSGRRAIRELLARNPGLTAVFASSDEMAIGAMVEACKMGIAIPEQLSVMGFDNVRLAEMSNPALTTVAQPLYEMGYRAVELLFELIDQYQIEGKIDWSGPTIKMNHQIVERESVKRRSL